VQGELDDDAAAQASAGEAKGGVSRDLRWNE
jgi:hypothetical protein